MSWAFWLNVLICLGSLYNARLDHGRAYAAAVASTGKERRNSWIKLILSWAVPVLAFGALPFTIFESRAIDKHLKHLDDLQSHRVITPSQVAAFKAATRDAPKGPVTVYVFYNEIESVGFGRQLRNVFNEAGYTLGSGSGFLIAPVPPKEPHYGQFLQVSEIVKSPAFARPMQIALEQAGISVGGREGPAVPDGELWIFVGLNPTLQQ